MTNPEPPSPVFPGVEPDNAEAWIRHHVEDWFVTGKLRHVVFKERLSGPVLGMCSEDMLRYGSLCQRVHAAELQVAALRNRDLDADALAAYFHALESGIDLGVDLMADEIDKIPKGLWAKVEERVAALVAIETERYAEVGRG